MASATTASAALSAATATRITSYTLTVTATAGQLLSTVLSVPFAATPSKAPAQSILDGEHTAPNVVSAAVCYDMHLTDMFVLCPS